MVRNTLPDTHKTLLTSARVISLAGTQPDTSDVGVGVFSSGTGVGLGSTVGVEVSVDVAVGVGEFTDVSVNLSGVGEEAGLDGLGVVVGVVKGVYVRAAGKEAC